MRMRETHEVGDAENAMHRDADPERVDLGADHEPAGRLEDDDPGADQDQHPLDRRRQALDLLVPVGVVLVGRGVGRADRDEAMTEATRSINEWIASVMIAIEPVIAPAASLSAIRSEFEAIERPAAPVFVRIIAPGLPAAARQQRGPRGRGG